MDSFLSYLVECFLYLFNALLLCFALWQVLVAFGIALILF